VPAALVVKNGSKISARIVGSTPGPVSPMVIHTSSPRGRPAQSVPPSGIASSALTTRLSDHLLELLDVAQDRERLRIDLALDLDLVRIASASDSRSITSLTTRARSTGSRCAARGRASSRNSVRRRSSRLISLSTIVDAALHRIAELGIVRERSMERPRRCSSSTAALSGLRISCARPSASGAIALRASASAAHARGRAAPSRRCRCRRRGPACCAGCGRPRGATARGGSRPSRRAPDLDLDRVVPSSAARCARWKLLRVGLVEKASTKASRSPPRRGRR
jgi:hypothetical protein